MLSKEKLEPRAKWPDGSFDKEAAIELLSLRKQLDDMREFALAIKALQNMHPSGSFLSEMKDLREKIDKATNKKS